MGIRDKTSEIETSHQPGKPNSGLKWDKNQNGEGEDRVDGNVLDAVMSLDKLKKSDGEFQERFAKVMLFSSSYTFEGYVRVLEEGAKVQVGLQAKYILKASRRPSRVLDSEWDTAEEDIPWMVSGKLEVGGVVGEQDFVLSPQMGTCIQTFENCLDESELSLRVEVRSAFQDASCILGPCLAMKRNLANLHQVPDMEIYFDGRDEIVPEGGKACNIDLRTRPILTTYLGFRFLFPNLVAEMTLYTGSASREMRSQLQTFFLADQDEDQDQDDFEDDLVVAVAPPGLDPRTLALVMEFLRRQDLTESILLETDPKWLHVYLQCQRYSILDNLPILQSAVLSFADCNFSPIQALGLLKHVVDPSFVSDPSFFSFKNKVTDTIAKGWADIKRDPNFQDAIANMSPNEFAWFMNCLKFTKKPS